MIFADLVSTYYQSWFRFHPEQAVAVGETGQEDRLTPFSDDDIGALKALNESLLSSLQELDTSSLTEQELIDFSILYSAASHELHDLIENDWRYRNPERFLPLNAIHQLLTRPVKNIHSALKHRLQAVPAHLRAARVFLSQHPERIPSVWLESAIAQAEAGVHFFLSLETHPVVLKRFDNPRRVYEYSEEASHALREFADFMIKELRPVAKGNFACGRTTFDRLLKERHFLDIDADQLYAFGQQLFDSTRKELQAQLGGRAIDEVLAEIKSDHPVANQLLDLYRDSIKRAQAFIREKSLVSVPDGQRLSVVETPDFLRHEIPFAAYDDPSRNDPEQHGHYYVTVPESAAGLEEHNRVSIDLTSVHEAYPGHHLQFSTANLTAGANSLVRVLNATSTFYEGWALYCEELMVEQGYLDKPEHKIIMLRDRLWRALRIMIDVDIHTRGVSVEDAATRLCDELGFEKEQAEAELNWYSFAPSVPMSYATGWALIRGARQMLERSPGFNLCDFHDRLLADGSVALPLVFNHRFGEVVYEQLQQQLFS